MARGTLTAAIALAVLALPNGALNAQAPIHTWVAPMSSSLRVSALGGTLAKPDTLSLPRTRWKEGALIGGAALGGLALVFSLMACGDTDSVYENDQTFCVLGTTAVSALLGATIGALIGGQIRVREPDAGSQ